MGVNDFIIESIDTKTISENDLEKIAEIEQDMWARDDGIGEYVKCVSCNHIDSKEDIFGYLAKDIKMLTVGKIEELLGINQIHCTECNNISEAIYDRNEYIEEIRNRYINSIESFLTVYRDGNGEIRGFADGYIDTFDNIYNKEFLYYYGNEGKVELKNKIEYNLKNTLPDEILIWTSVGLEEKYKSFYYLYKIIQNYFINISDERKNVLGLAESKLGSNTHGIYHSMGAKRLLINNKGVVKNKNINYESDIFIHPNAVLDYRYEFNSTLKEFLKKHSNNMREVLNIA